MSELALAAAETARLKSALDAATASLKDAQRAQVDLSLSAEKNAAATLAARKEVVAQTREVEKAKAAFKEAAEASKTLAQEQEELAKKQQKVKDLYAKGISEELPEKLKDASEAFKLFGDSSLSANDRTKALAAGVTITKGALGGYVGVAVGVARAVLDLAVATQQAAVEQERITGRTRELAGVMGQVSAATGGAGTAADAAAARYALLDAGLSATGEHTAALLEYARAHKRANEETSATLGRVVSAMQGNAAAADELGLRINANATSAEQATSALTQMAAANQRAGAAAESAAERQQRTNESLEGAKRGGLALLDSYFGISDAYKLAAVAGEAWIGVERRIADATGANTEELQRAFEASERLKEQQRAAAATQSARAQAEVQARDEAVAAAQRELAVQSGLLAAQGEATDASVRAVSAREAYVDVVTRSLVLMQREGETDTAFAQRRLAGLNAIQQARQRALQVEREGANRARASDELGVLASQLRTHGAVVASQVRSVSVQTQYVNLMREARDLRRSELETQTEFEQRAQETLQRAQGAQQAAEQRAAEAAARRVALRNARETFGLLSSEAALRGQLAGGASPLSLDLRLGSDAQVTQEERLARVQAAAADRSIRRADGERTLTDVLTRRATALQEILRLEAEHAQKTEDQLLLERRLIIALDEKHDLEATGAAQRMRIDAAAVGNADQFSQLRTGIGRQTQLAQTSRSASRGLQSGALSEADLRGQINDLEAGADDALREGTTQSAQRAAHYLAEAQALAGVIDGQRQLADAMRESNNASVQFATAFAGSEQAARRTGLTAEDAAKHSKAGFDLIAGSATQAFDAIIEGSMSAEEAAAAMGRNLLKGMANYFLTQALAEGAAAIGSLALGPPGFPAAALHFAAAAGWGAAAGIAGGIYAATAPAAASSSSSAGTDTPARGSDLGAGRSEGGPVIHQYNFNGLVTETQAARSLARVQNRGARAGIRPTFAERSR